MGISTHHTWAFAFGVLGNVASLVVFLAPVPTFHRVCKHESTEGFSVLPYLCGQLSAMLWLYYGFLHAKEDLLLITINAAGWIIETVYIALYIIYAPKNTRIFTLRLLVVLNFGGFCSILLLSYLLENGSTRVRMVGGICTALSVMVFLAPLSVMRLVIRTRSVEFMPFLLSFLLTVSALAWLLYGISLKDLYIALPNILGLLFGVAQMALYAIYRKPRPLSGVVTEEKKLQQNNNNNNNNNNGKDDTVSVEVQVQVDGAAADHHDHAIQIDDVTGIEHHST